VSALINFCEQCTKRTLEPYLDTILIRLSELLTSPFVHTHILSVSVRLLKKYSCRHRFVQEQTIVCIATVADSSQALFRNYYAHFMPHLKHILVATANGSPKNA
jgi:hypothetical protein